MGKENMYYVCLQESVKWLNKRPGQDAEAGGRCDVAAKQVWERWCALCRDQKIRSTL
jgi:hypothetical protein